MTPEQLQQYVDAALKQRDQFNLVFYPLTIVLSIGGAWLVSYFREKGKNLATKEDIAEITHKVESIKTDLAVKRHFSQVRYEREIEIYLQIWKKCFLLCEAVERLSVHDASHPKSQSSEIQACADAFNELILAIRDHRPFFPHEIWKELKLFQKLCYHLNLIKQSRYQSTNRGDELEDLPDKIESQLEKIEEAIRSRLDKFDGS